MKALAFLLGLAATAQAGVKTQPIEYRQGNTVLAGYLAYDDSHDQPRPAVIVVHDWMGLREFAKQKADALARLGYVAFAADIYGKDVRPANAQEAGQLAGKYKSDRTLLRARVQAAFEVVRKDPRVQPGKIAAMGYCFGGTAVLELARSGAPVAGVVSFHGGLDSPTPADAKKITGQVLVLHGADDPYVPPAEVAAFEKEMTEAGVDWQLIKYSGAVHSFTNPEANSAGARYHARADQRSWEALKQFLAEIFR
jgi:dienelactone hydrolase